LAINREGGLISYSGELIIPEPILLGRNESKLKKLAAANSVEKFSTDLDTCLADKNYQVYFDAQITNRRVEDVKKAITAGKAVYCEKPSADNVSDALSLYQLAVKSDIKNGVVQDKLWLPGILKLKQLIDSNFFGKILSVRAEFGYWVFDGKYQKCQRPSWNYRKEDGGGIILDMFAHWRYLIDNLFGDIKALTVLGANHIKERIDEEGSRYTCTAEDAAYATLELKNGTICHFNSSWVVRVRRDDLLTIQVEGTKGSAVAGLRNCWVQNEEETPQAVWNPDEESTLNYFDSWRPVNNNQIYKNAFRAQWELFLKHVTGDKLFPWTLLEGAKGVQLAELAYQSWQKRCWVEVPALMLEV
jgi:predicted dehydrogenase